MKLSVLNLHHGWALQLLLHCTCELSLLHSTAVP